MLTGDEPSNTLGLKVAVSNALEIEDKLYSLETEIEETDWESGEPELEDVTSGLRLLVCVMLEPESDDSFAIAVELEEDNNSLAPEISAGLISVSVTWLLACFEILDCVSYSLVIALAIVVGIDLQLFLSHETMDVVTILSESVGRGQ